MTKWGTGSCNLGDNLLFILQSFIPFVNMVCNGFVFGLLLLTAVTMAHARILSQAQKPFPYRSCNDVLPWQAELTHQRDLGTDQGSTLVNIHVWVNSSDACTKGLGQLEIGLPSAEGRIPC